MLLTSRAESGSPAGSAMSRNPETLSGLGGYSMTSLEGALANFGSAYAMASIGRFHIFILGRPRRLKPSVSEQVYLIAREALINAMRHSKAGHVEAEIEYLGRGLRVVVRDDGCGINEERLRARGPHRGLADMRDRAATLGAQLKLWSRPGAGTEVEIVADGAAGPVHAN